MDENTLRNAGRSYGVVEDLKGTKCTETFSDHLPVERGALRLEDSKACSTLGTVQDRSPSKGAQRCRGDGRYTPGRWPWRGWQSSRQGRLKFSVIKRKKWNKPITLENLCVFHYHRCLITHYGQFQELGIKNRNNKTRRWLLRRGVICLRLFSHSSGMLRRSAPASPRRPGGEHAAGPGPRSNVNRSGGGGRRPRPPPRAGHPSSSSFSLQPPSSSSRAARGSPRRCPTGLPRAARGGCPYPGGGGRALPSPLPRPPAAEGPPRPPRLPRRPPMGAAAAAGRVSP